MNGSFRSTLLPKKCSSKVLADALWIAGKASVNADASSRKAVCQWMDDAHLEKSPQCASEKKSDIGKYGNSWISLEGVP